MSYFVICRQEDEPQFLHFWIRGKLDEWLNDLERTENYAILSAEDYAILSADEVDIDNWPTNSILIIEGQVMRVVSQTVKVEYRAIP